jgi:hypothetical protein
MLIADVRSNEQAGVAGFPLQFAEDSSVPERTIAVDLKYPHVALIGVGNE